MVRLRSLAYARVRDSQAMAWLHHGVFLLECNSFGEWGISLANWELVYSTWPSPISEKGVGWVGSVTLVWRVSNKGTRYFSLSLGRIGDQIYFFSLWSQWEVDGCNSSVTPSSSSLLSSILLCTDP